MAKQYSNDEEPGREMNFIFNNWSGQLKYNTVVKLVPFLVKLGFFKKSIFCWLLWTPRTEVMLLIIFKHEEGIGFKFT